MAPAHPSLSTFSSGCELLSAMLVWILLLLPVDAHNGIEEVRALLSFKSELYSSSLYSGQSYSSSIFVNTYWSTWNESDENPCQWVGITCTMNLTVSGLDLSNLRLGAAGGLAMLSSLKDLRQLDLSGNAFKSMPDGIGNLTGLTLLDLSDNGMYGRIPHSISACRNLRYVDFSENYLEGDVASLSALQNLQILSLRTNQFSGSFPKELGQLNHLVDLDLSRNFLNGTLPALPHASSLVELHLEGNNFAGFEEDWHLGSAGANSSLQFLDVSYSQLQGMIPQGLTNLLNLQYLDMSDNRLSGSIPFGFSQLRNLQYLHMSGNRLSGNIPFEFSQLLNLQYLDMSGNRLSGSIPFGFSQLLNMTYLDFSQNQLIGDIPDDFLVQQSDNPLLCESTIILSQNLLTGGIPIDGAKFFCFATLDLSYNNLSGPIPPSIFDHDGNVNIITLYVQHNDLSGDIVDLMVRNQGPGNWSTTGLLLQNNRFTGDLSRIGNMSFDKFPLLSLLDVSNNDLRWSTSELMPDPIQATLERLMVTGFLWSLSLAGNNFSETSLPKKCFVNQSSVAVEQLDLSNCQLKGEILGAVFGSSCLPNITSLDLSNNDITGRVPNSIVMLPNLVFLDVSNNHLFGALPTIPQNSSLPRNATSFYGNPALCGPPLLKVCPLPGSGVPWWVFFVSISGFLTIALISCLAFTWRWRVYRIRHQQDADLIKTLLERDSATLMALRELKKATGDFAESAQIGQGGFATVYRGKLDDGTTVAIKKSKSEGSEKDKEQFLNEVRILSHVNHRNLVKLIGCCMENKVSVLVFEYVSHGTLQEHLKGKMGAQIRLTWEQRLKIAVQTADALNYLHTAATFPIYHRDVKSANILLNDNLDAKVADFGISRLAPLQATHVSTAAVQGTVGYIDPEYYFSYRLTDKSDVYSFGVVLLELISAKPAVDFLKSGEETNLVNLARSYMERGDLEGLIDPALMEAYTDAAGYARESILNVGRLAMECAEMRSKARPSMNEVLKELQNLWVTRNGTPTDLDSMSKDNDADAKLRDRVILLSECRSGSSCSLRIGDDTRDVELSQFSSSRGF